MTLIQSFNSLVALQNIIYNPAISEFLPGTHNLKTNTIINDQDEFDFEDLEKFENINSLLDEQLNPQKQKGLEIELYLHDLFGNSELF